MEHKYPENLIKQVNKISGNELIVFPEEGEFGFKEYLEEKSELIIKKKRLRTLSDNNKLILRYPEENAGTAVINRFFSSPDRISRGGEFRGCFVIDITDFIKKVDTEHFKRLLAYIRAHNDIHFMLIVFEKDDKKVSELYHALRRHDTFDLVKFTYPSGDDLAEWVLSSYSDYLSQEIPREAYDFLKSMLKSGNKEYSFAERLLEELQDAECEPDADRIQKTLSDLIIDEGNLKKDSNRIGFQPTFRE